MMLRDELDAGLLFRRKRGAIDDAPEFAVVENQRILHRRQLLVETNLVFSEAVMTDKAALIARLFGRISICVEARYPAAFHAVATNLLQTGPRAVDQDYRLRNLLGRVFTLLRLRLGRFRLRVLWFLSLRIRRPRVLGRRCPRILRSRRCRNCSGKWNKNDERGENYEGN